MPVEHYENFPVASILLPPHVRHPIQVIYAFARSADDFADEGNDPVDVRLAKLRDYEIELDAIAAGRDSPIQNPLFRDLGNVIRQHQLPIQLFRDLLDAFKQDVTQTRYRDFPELMHYCKRSADPIGRLLLALFKQDSAENLLMSDKICSSLQLINHWQDVAIDWQKNDGGRVYLPQDDLARFGLTDTDIANATNSTAWRDMMRFQTTRARQMMLEGQPLARRLGGRFGIELRLIVAGGLAVLDKIDAVNGDVFNKRPKLSKWDWLRIAPQALFRL
jgi:squalene synthase HpnC